MRLQGLDVAIDSGMTGTLVLVEEHGIMLPEPSVVGLDIMDRGMVLAGGGELSKHPDERLGHETGAAAFVVSRRGRGQ